MTERGLAYVFTVLPSAKSGNMGGFGQHTWCTPKVVANPKAVRQIDFQLQLNSESCSHQLCNVHDLRIQPVGKECDQQGNMHAGDERLSSPVMPETTSFNCRIQEYPGPLWLSIDYDFFSYRGYYHHNLREVSKEFRTFKEYLREHGIRPTEVLGYRSRDYLTLYSGEKRADHWIARIDECISELRSEILP